MAAMIGTLPDYPTADLGRPGAYPHRLIPGRELVIQHVIEEYAQPETIDQLARDQGWADLAPEEAAKIEAAERARLEAWEQGDWQYLGVVVSIRQVWGGHFPREIGEASVWRVESDAGAAYLGDVAADLFLEAQADVIALEAALMGGEPAPRHRVRK
jgi:hypothetical protein